VTSKPSPHRGKGHGCVAQEHRRAPSPHSNFMAGIPNQVQSLLPIGRMSEWPTIGTSRQSLGIRTHPLLRGLHPNPDPGNRGLSFRGPRPLHREETRPGFYAIRKDRSVRWTLLRRSVERWLVLNRMSTDTSGSAWSVQVGACLIHLFMTNAG